MARSVQDAKYYIAQERPELVLLDIFLSGKETGIDLAEILKEDNIPFIYLSANSNEQVLNKAKLTHPYGFLVKPLGTGFIGYYRNCEISPRTWN